MKGGDGFGYVMKFPLHGLVDPMGLTQFRARALEIGIEIADEQIGYAIGIDPRAFAEMMAEPWPGYTGPNVKLGDYYVRVHHYTPKSRYVYYDIVGVNRRERMLRREFDRMVRPA